jgi:hypothetical protein
LVEGPVPIDSEGAQLADQRFNFRAEVHPVVDSEATLLKAQRIMIFVSNCAKGLLNKGFRRGSKFPGLKF